MNNINPIIAQDIDFSKLLFELEQINLRLLVELKQQQRLKSSPKEQSEKDKTSKRLEDSKSNK